MEMGRPRSMKGFAVATICGIGITTTAASSGAFSRRSSMRPKAAPKPKARRAASAFSVFRSHTAAR